ncbi:MAG: GerAB/ArcD/ProY family transporter [Firmicutes bacterium]|nr:GerAB/ArcD/ProY family transporter [Bacillota bacterium]MDY5530665.1 GerAB/ArcD/ProY family transporter [Pumilibacteraceae bacterium]
MQVERPMITSRQFIILAFIGGMVIKGLMLPSLLMRISGKDGLFVLAFYFAIEILNLALISVLVVKYPEKTFFNMLEECFGKVGSRILCVLILIATTIKYTLNLSEVKAFFTLEMFSAFNWTVMIIPLVALTAVISVKSLRVLGRTAEIFFPFILAGILFLSLILFREVPLENVLPLGEGGIKPIADGIAEFPIWFGDVIVTGVALGNVKKEKGTVLKCVLMRVFAAVMIISFSVVLFATYGNIVPLVKYGHNITSLTQYNLGSQQYGRFDLIIYAIWVSGVFIKMAMNAYLATRCAAFALNVKNYKYVSAALAVLVFALSAFIVPTVSKVYILSTSTWAKIIFSLVEYCLPLTLFIAANVKYRGGETPEEDKASDGNETELKQPNLKGEKTSEAG